MCVYVGTSLCIYVSRYLWGVAECGKNVAISIADDNKASVSLYALCSY